MDLVILRRTVEFGLCRDTSLIKVRTKSNKVVKAFKKNVFSLVGASYLPYHLLGSTCSLCKCLSVIHHESIKQLLIIKARNQEAKESITIQVQD